MTTAPTVRRRRREFVAPPFSWTQIQERAEALNEPDWLIEMRREAWELYEIMPMPTLNDEAWRRTDYSHINWDTAGQLAISQNPSLDNIPAQHTVSSDEWQAGGTASASACSGTSYPSFAAAMTPRASCRRRLASRCQVRSVTRSVFAHVEG